MSLREHSPRLFFSAQENWGLLMGMKFSAHLAGKSLTHLNESQQGKVQKEGESKRDLL